MSGIVAGDGPAAGGRYSGFAKHEVCRRLQKDWADLADVLEIPDQDRARFEVGRQPHGVWAWLEQRNALSDLHDALSKIRRYDLVNRLAEDLELARNVEPAGQADRHASPPSPCRRPPCPCGKRCWPS